MIYIITEGKDGKSENKFWINICKYLNIQANIICANGNQNVPSELRKHYNKQDYFYIAIDNDDGRVASLRREYINIQNVRFSEYLCYEEIFLLFRGLKRYINNDNEELIDLFTIQELLLEGKIEEAKLYSRKLKDINTDTNEHFYSCVLSRITQYNKPIKINKRIFGVCWTCSCRKYLDSEYSYVCRNCPRTQEFLSFTDKYDELCKESILSIEVNILNFISVAAIKKFSSASSIKLTSLF